MDEHSFYLEFSQFFKANYNSDPSRYFFNVTPNQHQVATQHVNNSLGDDDFKLMKTILKKKDTNSCAIDDLVNRPSSKVQHSLDIKCTGNELEHVVKNMSFIVRKFIAILNECKKDISNSFVITTMKNIKKCLTEFLLTWSEDYNGDIEEQDCMCIEEHCLLVLVVAFKDQCSA